MEQKDIAIQSGSKDIVHEDTNDEGGGFLNSLLFLGKLQSSKKEKQDKKETENFELTEIASYGFPGIANCFSYEPIQKLLAIGTSTGRVVILGSSGIALRLNITLKHGVKNILFLSNLPIVVCVTDLNEIILLDIANITINKIYHSVDSITCIETFPDSKWLFVGTDMGNIVILDLVYGVESQHQLHKVGGNLKFLKMHPINYSQLLAGCSNGNIYLINLKTGKLILEYLINSLYTFETPIRLTTLCWSPKGDMFVSGFDNGWILFWSVTNNLENNLEPCWSRTVENETIDIALEIALPEERNSITGLQWCKFENSENTHLYVIGGNDVGTDNNFHTIEFSPNDIKLSLSKEGYSLNSKSIKSLSLIPTSNPWNSGLINPKALICLSENGAIYGFTLKGKETKFHILLEWLSCDIIHSKLFSQTSPKIHNAIIAHEASLSTQTFLNSEFELEGGVILPKQVDHFFYDFVMTSHKDGSIRLWDSSSNVLSPISHLTIWPNKVDGHEKSILTGLNFDADAGYLVTLLNSTSILVYGFCQRPKCAKHSPESSQNSTPNNNNHLVSGSSVETKVECDATITDESSLIKEEKEVNKNSRNQSRDNIYIATIDPSNRIDTSIFPSFELLGHRGRISCTVIKNGYLVAADTQGGFSITDIQQKIVIFQEREVTISTSKYTTILSGSSQKKDGVDDIEFISKIEVKKYSNDLRILCVSNVSNVYLYVLGNKDGALKIYKGKIFSGSNINQLPTYITFYSNDKLTNKSSSIDSKKLDSKNSSIDDKKLNNRTLSPEDKTILPLEENGSNNDEIETNNDSDNELKKKATWKDIKNIGATAANRLTKKLTMSPTKKRSKDNMLSQLITKKTSIPNIRSGLTTEITPISEEDSGNKQETSTIENTDTKSEVFDDIPLDSNNNSNNNSVPPSPSISPESKTKQLPKEILNSTDYSIVCFETKIIVHKLKDKKIINEVMVELDRGAILIAKLVKNHDNDILVCLTSKGFVDVYELPSLDFIHKTETALSETYNLDQCSITPDGRIFVNINQFELKQFCLYDNHHALTSPLCSKIQLYDPKKICPDLPLEEIPWYSFGFNRITPDVIVKTFDRNKTLDVKPIDRTKSNRKVRIRKYSDAAHSPMVCGVHSIGASQSIISSKASVKSNLTVNSEVAKANPDPPVNKPKSGLAAMLSLATNKLHEREEKLSNIEDTLKGTADASADFLKEIKAYNQRQANKKWYQL